MTRRAFSLIEALAATVLLAVVAAACIPILQSAARLGEDPSRAIDPGALAELADRVAANPVSFGVKESGTEYAIEWPDDLAHGAPSATAVIEDRAADDDAAAHPTVPQDRWLSLTCGARASLRWLPPAQNPNRPARSPRIGKRRRRRRVPAVRRGLTLVETLVALAITAMLAVAVVSWTVGSAQTAAKAEHSARASLDAESVVRLIRQEIACGDFDVVRRGAAAADPRNAHLRVDANALVVKGRRPDGQGDAIRRYEFDAHAGRLIARDEPPDGARTGGKGAPPRLVAEGLREFNLKEEGGRATQKPHVLTLAIGFEESDTLVRRLAIP